MKIYAIIDKNSSVTNGCFHIRLHQPLNELIKRGHQIEYASLEGDRWDEIKDADIVIFHRVYTLPYLGLLWRCKAAGIKVVYEIDDDIWNIPESNPAYLSFEQKWRQTVEDTIKEVDLVIVSTEALKKIISRLHDNIVVIPNSIPKEKWQKRPGGDELTIGWTGGANHMEDLLMIADDIKKLQNKYDFKFIMQGFTPRPIEADGYEENLKNKIGYTDKNAEKQSNMKLELYKKMLTLKNFYHIPFYPPEMYPKVLQRADIDIGLAPIKGHKFDESKSILKLLEYTACGTTMIASNLLPYKGIAPYTVDNDNWYDGIEKLINDKQLREDLLKKQEEICSPYTLDNVGDQWEKTFKNLLKKYVRRNRNRRY